ncbi:uncharacterized protein AB675_7748 [Cyphellophora attinorum]|uniref:Uncharacterized protein n=1 Tax=Cyphellophora attinorum TaxID=1664694 RepID=A0A0N1HU47_9EURO|nr:uncharacterized protein AB675_7748 [Phialophora attinorum]KPI40287.1 hypothetical protein AB675_7748 [Phialophora attinorum]
MTSPISFLTLPPEVRAIIYASVFDQTDERIKLELELDHHPDDHVLTSSHIQWQLHETSIHHPLFLVSKQVNAEAWDAFRTELYIIRDFAVQCETTKSGPRRPLCIKPVGGIHTGLDLKPWDLPPAALDDDYSRLLKGSITWSVTTLRLFSILGFNQRYMNKKYLPKLELVIFESIAASAGREDFPGEAHAIDTSEVVQIVTPTLDSYVSFVLQSFQSPWDVRAGLHDKRLLSLLHRNACAYTTTGLGSREDRGFDVHVTARIGICRVADSMGHKTAIADMKVTYDFDTLKVLRKWDWWDSGAFVRPRGWKDDGINEVSRCRVP